LTVPSNWVTDGSIASVVIIISIKSQNKRANNNQPSNKAKVH
jgi:hypothetical protein